MSSSTADGVMAATHKLVQQALTGQWRDVPKTIEERRMLLDRISAGATSQDQPWLNALKQAMTESDAAVAKMAQGAGTHDPGPGSAARAMSAMAPNPSRPTDAVANVMDMITSSR